MTKERASGDDPDSVHDTGETGARLKLSDIETTWRRRADPLRFTMIYSPAIRRLALALTRDEHEADEVTQELLAQVVDHGFPNYDPARGRFRHYLKQIVRNAALARLRRQARDARSNEVVELDHLAWPGADHAERAWVGDWRGCVLDQALRALERREREAGRGNLAHTVVRLAIDHPEADSKQLALLASERTGRPLTAEAFRKQLSRARRLFAELIVAETRQTLDQAGDDEVRDELAELGLWEHVRPYLSETC